MEGLVDRDIVVVAFPFTDLSLTRRRPALVLARLQDDDLIISKNRCTTTPFKTMSLS